MGVLGELMSINDDEKMMICPHADICNGKVRTSEYTIICIHHIPHRKTQRCYIECDKIENSKCVEYTGTGFLTEGDFEI
jgi:hypothetical protein